MQKNNNELFTTMSVGKAVAKLAVPTVIVRLSLFYIVWLIHFL